MRVLRDAAWVSLGAFLGTAICFAVIRFLAPFAAVDAVPLASLTVFVMLVGSLQDPWRPSPIPD